MKSYAMFPLAEQEQAAYDGFTHLCDIGTLPFINSTTNGATLDLTLSPIPMGGSVLFELVVRKPFQNKSDTAYNSLTLTLLDDAAATLLAATELNANNGVVYNDGATNSNTTLTSATAAFVAGDVGKRISGGSIPAGTTIASRTNGTTVVLSQAATTTATGVTITLPDRSSVPVVTPVVRSALSGVYAVDSHVIARFTPLTGKKLSDANSGDLQILMKLIDPRAITKLKGIASDR